MLSVVDVVAAAVLVLIALIAVNSIITIPSYDYSYESHNIKSAQDIMEMLSGKIDSGDKTFLSRISGILKDNKNSKEAIDEVSQISKNKLSSYDLTNYRFCENNIIGGEVLASSGDYNKADNIFVATRNYGEYSYSLYVW